MSVSSESSAFSLYIEVPTPPREESPGDASMSVISTSKVQLPFAYGQGIDNLLWSPSPIEEEPEIPALQTLPHAQPLAPDFSLFRFGCGRISEDNDSASPAGVDSNEITSDSSLVRRQFIFGTPTSRSSHSSERVDNGEEEEHESVASGVGMTAVRDSKGHSLNSHASSYNLNTESDYSGAASGKGTPVCSESLAAKREAVLDVPKLHTIPSSINSSSSSVDVGHGGIGKSTNKLAKAGPFKPAAAQERPETGTAGASLRSGQAVIPEAFAEESTLEEIKFIDAKGESVPRRSTSFQRINTRRGGEWEEGVV